MSAWEKDIEIQIEKIKKELDKLKWDCKHSHKERVKEIDELKEKIKGLKLPGELKNFNIPGEIREQLGTLEKFKDAVLKKYDPSKNPMSDLEKNHCKIMKRPCSCAHCQALRKIQERGYIGVNKTELEKLFRALDGQTLSYRVIFDLLIPFKKKYLPELE